MKTIKISTKKDKEVIDITNIVDLEVKGIDEGLVSVFSLHTTAAITTADLDPGTDQDMMDAFKEIVPKLAYRHPHNPEHTPDHIITALIGSSLVVPIKDSKLYLGAWQRVVLVEMAGPREREIVITVQNLDNKTPKV
ncbi:MAG: secondary thiamine-phosphate synthase enzyme YjbQ [bacterium]|nr:secondary thiamine-phosphate synthase enzyme YjbQ [bacterium]